MHIFEVVSTENMERKASKILDPWTLDEQLSIETELILEPSAEIDRLIERLEKISSAGEQRVVVFETKRNKVSDKNRDGRRK